MPEWISVSELSKLNKKTERGIRKDIQDNKYVFRVVQGKTHPKYEILVDSLDYELKNVINFEKSKNQIEKKVEPSLQKTKPYSIKAQQIALARYSLVNLWVEYKKEHKGSETVLGKEFLDIYNQGIVYSALFAILGNVSIGSIYRWYQKIKLDKNYLNLLPNYHYGPKEHCAKLTNNEEIVFKSLLLSPRKMNIGKATKLTKYTLGKKGLESPSSESTFRRFADDFKNKNHDIWVFSREGEKALKDKVLPYIERDPSLLEVGDVLVADGHRLAIQCINPFTGKECRPTLIGYLDWKSCALVGYEIMLEENTQAIASALRNSIINLGKYPKISYQDNGKAFKSKFFTGDLRESGIEGLFEKLNIIPVFARPYNAKAKVIERFFKELQEGFERLMPSFCGANINDKPANLKRNEKFHKENHNDFIPTLEQLSQMLDSYMDFYNSQPCPHVEGKTIGEVFNEGKGSGVDLDKLDDLMMSKEIKTIHQNGITFLKANYYNEDLYGLRERVLIKYSLLDLTKIKVYSLNNEFLCIAHRTIPVNPMAQYLGDVKDVETLKQKLKQQQKLEKKTIKEVKTYLETEQIKPLDWQNETPALLVDKDIKKEVSFKNCDVEENIIEEDSTSRPNFEHSYERYEWHLKNGFENDREVVWFKEYELTDEYKQIYGKEENESKVC